MKKTKGVLGEYATNLSKQNKRDLLADMVRMQPALGINNWWPYLEQWLIEFPVHWSILELYQPISSSWADIWIAKHGPWYHGGHSQEAHNRLGMAYAAFMTESEYGTLDSITLQDSPDFVGHLGDKRIMGDVGDCSALAMFNALGSFFFHDLWVSVLGDRTQVILEFWYGPGALRADLLGFRGGFGGPPTKQQVSNCVRSAFYCPDCDMWTIDAASVARLYKDWLQYVPREEAGAVPQQLALPALESAT